MITLSDTAVQRVLKTCKSKTLRIKILTNGCSGYSYKLECGKVEIGDSFIAAGEASVVVDPKSYALISDLHIDFVKEGLNEGFKFTNPLEVGRCGCGESFRI